MYRSRRSGDGNTHIDKEILYGESRFRRHLDLYAIVVFEAIQRYQLSSPRSHGPPDL